METKQNEAINIEATIESINEAINESNESSTSPESLEDSSDTGSTNGEGANADGASTTGTNGEDTNSTDTGLNGNAEAGGNSCAEGNPAGAESNPSGKYVQLSEEELQELCEKMYLKGRNSKIEAEIAKEPKESLRNKLPNAILSGVIGAATALLRPGRRSVWPQKGR